MTIRTIPAIPAIAVISVCIYLCLTSVVLLATLHKTAGHFVYSLDDPYIQLALSENIAHGHYGINAGEPSSPSSSAIWPLFLLPFAGTRFHVFLPLIWNILFGIVSAWLIGWSINRWPNRPPNPSRRFMVQQIATAFLLIMTASLVAIAFVGMEHGLEILLALSCAYGITEALAGRNVPAWCLLAAALGPLVRYEAFDITVAMVVLLAGLRRWRSALALLLAAAIPLAGFGLFFHHLGLPPLPTSVLVKSGAFGEGSAPASYGSFLSNLLQAARQTFLITVNRWIMLSLAIALIALAWKSSNRTRRFVFAGAALVPALQVAVGPFGGFHRYEIYATAFASMILMYAVAEYNRLPFAAILLGLLLISERSMQFTIQTPQAASGIYGQQYQMHRFVTEFFHGRFAAYDIGLVSYQKPESAYVLDLGGLSSIEVGRHQDADAAWLAELTNRNRIALAMIPPGWPVPSTWVMLGQLRLLTPPITAAGPCVSFWSTNPSQQQAIRDDLARFVKTLPSETVFDFAGNGSISSPCTTPDR